MIPESIRKSAENINIQIDINCDINNESVQGTSKEVGRESEEDDGLLEEDSHNQDNPFECRCLCN